MFSHLQQNDFWWRIGAQFSAQPIRGCAPRERGWRLKVALTQAGKRPRLLMLPPLSQLWGLLDPFTGWHNSLNLHKVMPAKGDKKKKAFGICSKLNWHGRGQCVPELPEERKGPRDWRVWGEWARPPLLAAQSDHVGWVAQVSCQTLWLPGWRWGEAPKLSVLALQPCPAPQAIPWAEPLRQQAMNRPPGLPLFQLRDVVLHCTAKHQPLQGQGVLMLH